MKMKMKMKSTSKHPEEGRRRKTSQDFSAVTPRACGIEEVVFV